MSKKLTVGIPAYKADEHIRDCLASIQIQTIRDDVEVIIYSDEDGDERYEYLKTEYPSLDLTIIRSHGNVGPGLARQRCLDAATTDWITFIDADDVLYSPFALESLYGGTLQQDVVEVQGVFLQEVSENPQGVRSIPIENPGHPWVFGRLYSTKFLKSAGIAFDETRAMEDGQFNWKIRMTIEGSQFKINMIPTPVYLWRIGSEHSITRMGADDEDGIPQYNFDLCQIGATIAAIRAAKFCKEKNPFNGNIDRFVTEMMVDKYFTYIECVAKKPMFAIQNMFNAKRFYHECYKDIEPKISDKILSDIYTVQRAQHGEELIGVIPKMTFGEFMNYIKLEEYGGEDELKEIRGALPIEVIENDLKTGVATF